jgi:hypothetical protein
MRNYFTQSSYLFNQVCHVVFVATARSMIGSPVFRRLRFRNSLPGSVGALLFRWYRLFEMHRPQKKDSCVLTQL